MSRYRAKQIRYYDDREDIFIIQKKVLGLFWVDYETKFCEYYTNIHSAYLRQSNTNVILNHEFDVMNVLDWLESNKNHSIFICSDNNKNKGKVVYGISIKDNCDYTWNASIDLSEAKEIEEKHQYNIKHIIIWKYNKKTGESESKFLIKDGKRIFNQC